jgi:hypothetical protein
MPAAKAVVLEETELERIRQWRADELERAGYAPDAASELAARQDIDLHLAVGLVQQGCSPDLALQILL